MSDIRRLSFWTSLFRPGCSSSPHSEPTSKSCLAPNLPENCKKLVHLSGFDAQMALVSVNTTTYSQKNGMPKAMKDFCMWAKYWSIMSIVRDPGSFLCAKGMFLSIFIFLDVTIELPKALKACISLAVALFRMLVKKALLISPIPYKLFQYCLFWLMY